MNNIKLFLNVRIKNTGFLAGLGNFFLNPVRWLFSGKTAIVTNEETGTIAKVSSYSDYQWKKSKQDPNLQTSAWLVEYDPRLILFPLLFIPFAILGAIFKALSYLDSNVRKNHDIVKNKLTPENQSVKSGPNLENELHKRILMTGQKINALIIKDQIIDHNGMAEIRRINPLKLILENSTVCNYTVNTITLEVLPSLSDLNKTYLGKIPLIVKNNGNIWIYGYDADGITPKLVKSDHPEFYEGCKDEQKTWVTPAQHKDLVHLNFVKGENINIVPRKNNENQPPWDKYKVMDHVPSVNEALSHQPSFFQEKHTIYLVENNDTADLTCQHV